MENQHRQIKGYRELNEQEIALMNEVKIKGVELGELIAKVREYLTDQKNAATLADDIAEHNRRSAAQPDRWASVGATDLQTGLMALTRAIAQPTFF